MDDLQDAQSQGVGGCIAHVQLYMRAHSQRLASLPPVPMHVHSTDRWEHEAGIGYE